MSGVNEALKRIGPSVGLVNSKESHAVISPSMITWKRGHRHEFDMGDTELL